MKRETEDAKSALDGLSRDKVRFLVFGISSSIYLKSNSRSSRFNMLKITQFLMTWILVGLKSF